MLTSPATALEIIFGEVSSLSQESIPLLKASGYYLSEPVVACVSLPPFDNSAMDGFACRAQDVKSASPNSPVSLKIIRTSAAGDSRSSLKPLQAGETVRVMTGAPMPCGADTVIPFEEAKEDAELCMLSHSVKACQHVRKKGEDIREGTPVLEAGVRLTPRKMALLAAMGLAKIPVTRKPKVAVFSTGDELQPLDSKLEYGQIYDSNGPSLYLALEELGIDPILLPTPKDTLASLLDTFRSASTADVILSMGAVSAGDFDLIPQTLEKLSARILFHKLAIKPGKPLLFACLNQTKIFCLPGNPVSSLVVFDRFVRPALLKMMGARRFFRNRYTALVTHEMKATEGKEDYLRGQVEWKDGSFFAKLAGPQGSAHLGSLAGSNALLIIPESVSRIREGESVSFEFWGDA